MSIHNLELQRIACVVFNNVENKKFLHFHRFIVPILRVPRDVSYVSKNPLRPWKNSGMQDSIYFIFVIFMTSHWISTDRKSRNHETLYYSLYFTAFLVSYNVLEFIIRLLWLLSWIFVTTMAEGRLPENVQLRCRSISRRIEFNEHVRANSFQQEFTMRHASTPIPFALLNLPIVAIAFAPETVIKLESSEAPAI